MATPESIYRQPGGQQDYTPAAATSAGTIVELGDGRAGHVVDDLAANQKGAVYTSGIFEVLAATGTTFAAGDGVWWDVSASLAITTPGAAADLYCGTAAQAKGAELYVWVDLNVGAPGAAQAGCFVSRAQSIDHADTAENMLIEAGDNHAGLYIQHAFGIITEVSAGDTEDQLVVTIYDSDDNALSVLTCQNASADAVGDIIQGTLTLATAATGTVPALIPADKGVYAKVSQATSGTSLAGAMTVSLIVAPVI